MSKIVLLGLPGAGKDTVADFWCKGSFFQKERFAAPLKAAAERVFGEGFDTRLGKEFPVHLTDHQRDILIAATFDCLVELGFDDNEISRAEEHFFEWYAEEGHLQVSPRRYQNVLGTYVVRKVRPDAFTQRLEADTGRDLVIADARFLNEARVGYPVYVWNPRIKTTDFDTNIEKLNLELAALAWGGASFVDHPELGQVAVLLNDGTLEELEYAVSVFKPVVNILLKNQ